MQPQGAIQQVIEDQLIGTIEESLGEVPEGGREYAQDTLDEIYQDIIQQAAPESFEKVELYLATPIYESNTAKIGLLDSDEIEQLVKFHRFLDITRDEVNRVIETAGDSDDSNLESRLHTLENNLEELESRREEVLNTLGEDTDEIQHSEELLPEATEEGDQGGINETTQGN